MKYLLAFALVAVATALPEPVRLPQPALPEVAPLLIPQPVASPVVVDAPEAAAPVDAVKVADAPVEAVPADFTLNIVDVVPEIAEAPVENFAVKIVDNADVNVAAEIANVADVDEETPSYIPIDVPFQIKIVDMPLPDSVVMPLLQPVKIEDAPVESNDFAVKFVDVVPEVPVMSPKRYPDPMWRSAEPMRH
ncbi:calphotin-like [Cydia splendana]|uniref:calphotin-like n=1 Tax=Cydia splendana TaxID=1100963 RepID=UPI00300CDBD8